MLNYQRIFTIIYLQHWAICGVNVGKYSSTMAQMGIVISLQKKRQVSIHDQSNQSSDASGSLQQRRPGAEGFRQKPCASHFDG